MYRHYLSLFLFSAGSLNPCLGWFISIVVRDLRLACPANRGNMVCGRERGTLSYTMACNHNGHRYCAQRVAHSRDNALHKEANDALLNDRSKAHLQDYTYEHKHDASYVNN